MRGERAQLRGTRWRFADALQCASIRVEGERARRWVVERTHSWFNRYRKLLIPWEKKPQDYVALVQFAAALLVWRPVGL
jgi:transposase